MCNKPQEVKAEPLPADPAQGRVGSRSCPGLLVLWVNNASNLPPATPKRPFLSCVNCNFFLQFAFKIDRSIDQQIKNKLKIIFKIEKRQLYVPQPQVPILTARRFCTSPVACCNSKSVIVLLSPSGTREVEIQSGWTEWTTLNSVRSFQPVLPFAQSPVPLSESPATDPPIWTRRCCSGRDASRQQTRYQSLCRKEPFPVYTRPPSTLASDWPCVWCG